MFGQLPPFVFLHVSLEAIQAQVICFGIAIIVSRPKSSLVSPFSAHHHRAQRSWSQNSSARGQARVGLFQICWALSFGFITSSFFFASDQRVGFASAIWHLFSPKSYLSQPILGSGLPASSQLFILNQESWPDTIWSMDHLHQGTCLRKRRPWDRRPKLAYSLWDTRAPLLYCGMTWWLFGSDSWIFGSEDRSQWLSDSGHLGASAAGRRRCPGFGSPAEHKRAISRVCPWRSRASTDWSRYWQPRGWSRTGPLHHRYPRNFNLRKQPLQFQESLWKT